MEVSKSSRNSEERDTSVNKGHDTMCRGLKKYEFCSVITEILNFLTHLIRDSYFLGVSRGTLRLPARKFRPDFCILICDQRGLKTSKIDAARRERSIPHFFFLKKNIVLILFLIFYFFSCLNFFRHAPGTCLNFLTHVIWDSYFFG